MVCQGPNPCPFMDSVNRRDYRLISQRGCYHYEDDAKKKESSHSMPALTPLSLALTFLPVSIRGAFPCHVQLKPEG